MALAQQLKEQPRKAQQRIAIAGQSWDQVAGEYEEAKQAAEQAGQRTVVLQDHTLFLPHVRLVLTWLEAGRSKGELWQPSKGFMLGDSPSGFWRLPVLPVEIPARALK
jgi:hypothetical protein